MLRRHLESRLREALADTPVVLLHGARQTGKTTLVQAVSGGRTRRQYLTLDDATTLAAAQSDPDGFIAAMEGPVALDEVQRAPGLFTAIKASVDRDRRPGRFLLTGSANVLLLPRLSDSLAGRVEIVSLWPLSQGEIAGHVEGFIDAAFGSKLPSLRVASRAKADTLDRILRGGYPEPLGRKDESRRAAWYASYLATILQRDVRDLSNIEGLADLPRLLALLASRTSGLLNFADLSRSLSIAQTSLKRYFALLEATFLVQLLPAWATNQGLRLTKAPKVMLTDTGLACHLLGMDRSRLTSDGHARGSLLENLVAMELLKQTGWSSTRVKLHHFRTQAGREVDLVLEDARGQIVGIEIKFAASATSADFDGLRTLREIAGDRFVRGIVLYSGEQTIPFDPQLAAAPLSAVWTW